MFIKNEVQTLFSLSIDHFISQMSSRIAQAHIDIMDKQSTPQNMCHEMRNWPKYRFYFCMFASNRWLFAS